MINIDKVYQTVQDLLNVEQRGYVPSTDFNNFAELAQRDLFDKLFSDKAHFKVSRKGGDGELVDSIQEKIDIFVVNTGITKDGGTYALPTDTYHVKDVYLTTGTKTVIVEQIDHKWSQYIFSSALTEPTATFPKYKRFSSGAKGVGELMIYPSSISDGVTVDYIKTPSTPIWGSVSPLGTALYNADTSNDFDLHPSMYDELVDKVVYYAAISIKQTDVIQVMQGEMTTDTNIDKS